MTDPRRLWLYPRLPRTTAKSLAARLQRTEPEDRIVFAAVSHPRAAPAPTGGTPVPEDHLLGLADAMRAEFDGALGQPISNNDKARVDARFGRVLHDRMAIIPSDAAHEGVWSFLSIVLLPDVATWRFPDCHPGRLLGTYRNVFRRTWWRQHVLGDILAPEAAGDRPLGEDELVGIFERSRMARSHLLARRMARYISDLEVTDRSSFARELAKRIRRVLAYVNMDALAADQIDSIVHQAGAEVRAARGNIDPAR